KFFIFFGFFLVCFFFYFFYFCFIIKKIGGVGILFPGKKLIEVVARLGVAPPGKHRPLSPP
ncbi:hypothetical protein ACVGXF_00705, partial [Enterobacter hormaechei]